jgi:hypothetical protein
MGSAPTNGNLLVAFTFNDGSQPSVDSGWTQLVLGISGTLYGAIYYKTAGASESASQTPSTGGTGNFAQGIWEISGAVGGSGSFLADIIQNITVSGIAGATPVLPISESQLFLGAIATYNTSDAIVGTFGVSTVDVTLSGSGVQASFGHSDSTTSPAFGMVDSFSAAVGYKSISTIILA